MPPTRASTAYENGGEGQVGSVVKVVYTDKTVWQLREY